MTKLTALGAASLRSRSSRACRRHAVNGGPWHAFALLVAADLPTPLDGNIFRVLPAELLRTTDALLHPMWLHDNFCRTFTAPTLPRPASRTPPAHQRCRTMATCCTRCAHTFLATPTMPPPPWRDVHIWASSCLLFRKPSAWYTLDVATRRIEPHVFHTVFRVLRAVPGPLPVRVGRRILAATTVSAPTVPTCSACCSSRNPLPILERQSFGLGRC